MKYDFEIFWIKSREHAILLKFLQTVANAKIHHEYYNPKIRLIINSTTKFNFFLHF